MPVPFFAGRPIRSAPGAEARSIGGAAFCSRRPLLYRDRGRRGKNYTVQQHFAETKCHYKRRDSSLQVSLFVTTKRHLPSFGIRPVFSMQSAAPNAEIRSSPETGGILRASCPPYPVQKSPPQRVAGSASGGIASHAAAVPIVTEETAISPGDVHALARHSLCPKNMPGCGGGALLARIRRSSGRGHIVTAEKPVGERGCQAGCHHKRHSFETRGAPGGLMQKDQSGRRAIQGSARRTRMQAMVTRCRRESGSLSLAITSSQQKPPLQQHIGLPDVTTNVMAPERAAAVPCFFRKACFRHLLFSSLRMGPPHTAVGEGRLTESEAVCPQALSVCGNCPR